MIFLLWLRYVLDWWGWYIEQTELGCKYCAVLFFRIEQIQAENSKRNNPEDERRSSGVYNVPRRHLFYIYKALKDKWPRMKVKIEKHGYTSPSYDLTCDWTNV